MFYRTFIEPRESRNINRLRSNHHQASSWFLRHTLHEPRIDWKSSYKLRYNWHKGRCSVDAIDMWKSESTDSDMLVNDLVVRFRGRNLITADSKHGLRAWDAEGFVIATKKLPQYSDSELNIRYGDPSALYLCSLSGAIQSVNFTVLVGFKNGGFAIYTVNISAPDILTLRYTHPPYAQDDPIASVVYEYPFLATLSKEKVVEIFKFEAPDHSDDKNSTGSPCFTTASLVTSLKSQSISGPISLSMRKIANSDKIYATIAYSHPIITSSEWTVAIQELELDSRQGLTRLRAASAPPRSPSSLFTSRLWASSTDSRDVYLQLLSPKSPTSLAYTHPFLLTSHADNSLVSYLVESTSTKLYIKSGERLWGHTRSVANVQVKARGKAVSVSTDGEEIRVWDLEPLSAGRLNQDSVQLQIVGQDCKKSRTLGKYLDFDDERVVVEEESQAGKRVMLYDFT